MAALYILNETPFWFSHELVHVNLRCMLRKQVDSAEITISQQTTEKTGQTTISSVLADNMLERYWKRDMALEKLSFMTVCEQYEYSGNKRKSASDRLFQFEPVSFSRLNSATCFVLFG